jgi:FKBP-type peptidyl-prolyl cis-trans isomerase FkpA
MSSAGHSRAALDAIDPCYGRGVMWGRRFRLLAAFAALAVAGAAAGCGRKARMVGGVSIEDLKVGSGATATAGKFVAVHYAGRLLDGTKFGGSQDTEFELGSGKVIRGWDLGIEGMRVGGKRKLTIPPEFAYGSLSGGPIPPHATLVFDVELMAVK